MHRPVIAALLFLFVHIAGMAQLPTGHWRYHQSFYHLRSLVDMHNRVYAAGPGGLFFIDLNTQEIRKLNPLDGLYALDVVLLAPFRSANKLMLGYSDGTLQFFDGDRFETLTDVRTSDLTGGKSPLSFTEANNKLYVGFEFGLLALQEIGGKIRTAEAVRNITSTTQQLAVNSLAVYQDSLFVNTANGFYAASLNDNLLDFNSWSQLTKLRFSAKEKVFVFEGRLMVAASQGLIDIGNGKRDTLLTYPSDARFLNVFTHDGNLFLEYDQQGAKLFEVIGEDFALQAIANSSDYLLVGDVLKQADTYYIADELAKGLLKKSDTLVVPLSPNGPLYFAGWRLNFLRDSLYMTTGGYTPSTPPLFNALGYQSFANGQWLNYSFVNENIPFFFDAIDVAYVRQTNKFYVSSHNQGLYEFAPDSQPKLYNYANSPLSQVENVDQTRLTGLEVDKDGTLWVLDFYQNNPGSNPASLYSLDVEGNWEAHPFPNYGVRGSNHFAEELIIDDFGSKWMRVLPNRVSFSGQNMSLGVYNENGNRFVNLNMSNGLPSNSVISLAKDQEGAIWMGTVPGMCVIYNPSEVFESPNVTVPIFDGRPVLENNSVSAIEVDRANRKWCGTTNGGVWLFNEDATEEILSFNVDNSPLPSNNIVDIEINPNTGEVFFLTDKGLVSYMGDAADQDTDSDCLAVYPNPVPPSFQGEISINCLPVNARVKITDEAGIMAFEGKAKGTKMTWDLRDYSNQEVATGVYFIYASDDEGGNELLGKFAVVRGQ